MLPRDWRVAVTESASNIKRIATKIEHKRGRYDGDGPPDCERDCLACQLEHEAEQLVRAVQP